MFKPIRFAVLLAGVTLAVSAMAQPAPDDDGYDRDQSSQRQTADPPSRVARLSVALQAARRWLGQERETRRH